MSVNFTRRVAMALGLAAISLAGLPALADTDYPSKPVTLVVAYAAGGGTDAIARVFADLRSDGKTIVFVHHDLGSVREYCDQVTLLNRTVVASGPVDTTYTTDAIGETFEMSLDERALFGAA